jgi:hypothetical protein
LEDECEEITADEDVGVRFVLQSRVVGTYSYDGTAEIEVDTGSNEGGREGEWDEVAMGCQSSSYTMN